MGAEQKKDEEAIYYAAIAKPAVERDSYIKAACGDDTNLLALVEALLKAHEVDDDFLKAPILDDRVTLDESPLTEGPGTVIGRYKLLEKIGEGGMAVVYMAEQQEPIQRRVALKIVKLGMDTKSVIARFEAERQALAMMGHPNIAKVHDAGATETGRPYFVMELVTGVSITEYCDKNNLSTKDRLVLFIQVCNAVQHAHQKGIIHRDIKPSNIMVTLHDGKPVPKVIDFGIAKATNQRLTEKTLFTRYAHIIGTPAYMSPEQAELSGLDIDTRTDVFSLGTLLYELLTGSPPFSSEYLLRQGYKEMQRIIREEEPTRPSTKLSTLKAALTDVARWHNCSPELLPKLVRGDLDWIVMKSLEKDRNRRYDTASELGMDVQRHLNDEPIQAAAPSVSYRLRKLIMRHRTLVVSSVIILIVLLSGIVVSTMFALGQAEERRNAEESGREARRQAQIAKAVVGFLNNDLLSSTDPVQARGREVTVREILDTASDKIEDQFKDEPLVEASIRMTLAQAYLSLGEYEEAEPHFRRALEINKASLDPSDPNVAITMSNFAQLLQDTNRLTEAESLLTQAAEIIEKYYGPNDPRLATAFSNLATVFYDTNRLADAEPMFRRALSIDEASLDPNDPTIATDLNNLAELLRITNRLDEAEPLYRRALAIDELAFDQSHLNVSRDLNNLAVLLMVRNGLAEAEPLMRRALAIDEQCYGQNHPNVAIRLNNLAELLKAKNELAEAETMMRRALAIDEQAFGKDHPSVACDLNNLGQLLCATRRFAEAEPMCRRALAIDEQALSKDHPGVAIDLNNLAVLLMQTIRFEEAEPMLRRALTIDEKAYGREHPNVGRDLSNLAEVLRASKRFSEAFTLMQRSLEIHEKNSGPNHPTTRNMRNHLEGLRKQMKDN